MKSRSYVFVAAAALFPLFASADDLTQSEKTDLEARVKALEAQRKTTQSPSLFNPSIALVLGGTYSNFSRDPELYHLQGFIPGGEEVGPGSRSFSLGESELTFSATVDQLFAGVLTFALGGDGSASVEEAKVDTLGLANGFNLRFGRFLSGLGYLNNQHAHTWDFVDAPLSYKAFFGGQYKNDGVQARWLAPTDQFLELGAELGLGAEFPGTDRNRNGSGVVTIFGRLGDDLGTSASWQGNVWVQHAKAQDRVYEDQNSNGDSVSNAFSGNSKSWGLGLVYKWSPNGNGKEQNFKAQAEFIQRRESGDLSYDIDGVAPATGAYDSKQSGFYAQSIYQFMPRWRVGARYDRLNSGTTEIGLVQDNTLTADDFAQLQDYNPARSTIMLDYSPSEFSRFRLQFSHDKSSPDAADKQIFLQYVISMGAHGAHGY